MVNKVILVGRLGKDPEVRHLENSVTVANFSLATDEIFKDSNGERQTRTDWHNLACWRRNAEIAEKYLRKGSLIYCEGKMKTRSWDDKDGNKRYTTEVVVDFFKMLDSKRNDDDGSQSNQQYTSNSQSQDNSNQGSPMGAPQMTNNEMQVEEKADDLPF